MAPREKGMMSHATAFPITYPSQEPMAPDGCSDPSATLDLAALSEGTLSKEGLERLATHVLRCQTCKATLASLVEESRNDTEEHEVLGRLLAIGNGRRPSVGCADE